MEPKTHLAVRAYSGEPGSSNLPVYHIKQDSQGFLWIANEEGLFRYDGEHFRRFGTEDGLPSRTAMYVFEDGRHRLWVQTRKELARFNGRSFETFGAARGLPDESHWAKMTPMTADERGLPWVTSGIGPHRLRSDDRFELVPGWPGSECTALASGPNREVWTASWDEAAKTNRIMSFEHDVWRTWSLPPALKAERVIDLLADTEGRVWARTLNDLWMLSRGSPAFEHHSSLPPHPLRAGYLSLDPNGDLLVPTQEALYRLDGGQWKAWTVDQGLPTSWLYNAIVDREGSLWVGGTGGLFRVFGRSLWGGATRTDGLPDNSVWALSMDAEQHLWVGTGNGLVRVTNDGFELVKGTQSRTVWALAFEKSGKVWMGLPLMGLWRWDPRTQHMEKLQVGPSEGAVVQLVIDPDDVMWIATTRLGLYSLDLKSPTLAPVHVELPDGKPDETILSIALGKDGRIWAPGETGLALRESGKWRRLSTQDGLLERHTSIAYETRGGDLLVAYQERQGVSRFRYENGTLRLLSHPSPTSAASSESIYSIFEDSRGWLWLGTGRGVVLQTPFGEEQFTQRDGLISEDFTIPTLEAPTGEVWMGTSNGLVVFRAKRYTGPPTLLAPSLMEAQVNDRAIEGGPRALTSARSNAFRAYLSSFSFANQGKIQYEARMSSAGEDWHPLTSSDVSYPILAPADYVLEARARVGHGRWSPTKTFSFRILPTWYQNPWVRAAAVLGFAITVSVLVVRVRERAARAEKRRLEDLIEARTRELNTANGNMRLVLDNVEQGLAIVNLEGQLMPEPSAAFASWFGTPPPGSHFASHIAATNAAEQGKLRIGYEQVTDGFLPAGVALEQLPKELVVGNSHYALKFKPVIHGAGLEGTLLMVSDVTEQVAARRADAIQREQIETFELVMRDRFGYLEFFTEARTLTERIRENRFATPDERMRAIHTLKGNAALFRAKSVADAAHRLEQALLDDETELADRALGELGRAWERYSERTLRLLGENPGEQVHFSRIELKDLIVATSAVGRGERSIADLGRMLQGLRGVPVRERLARIGEQITALSVRFGKGTPEVVIEADDFRLSTQRYGPFWASFAHLVRNVVDHGFETPAERRAADKPEANRVTLSAKLKEASLYPDCGRRSRDRLAACRRKSCAGGSLPCHSRRPGCGALSSGHQHRRDADANVWTWRWYVSRRRGVPVAGRSHRRRK